MADDMDTKTAHKIHTKVVIDAEDNVVEDEFYFYDGEMAHCGAGDHPPDDLPDDPPADPIEDPDDPPNPPITMADMTQDQFMSWMGRVNKEQIAKQFDAKVLPALEEIKAGRTVTDATPPSGDLQDLMFTDPEKFFEKGMEKYQKKVKTITDVKTKSIDEAILTFAEDPLYRDIHSEMKKIARSKVGEGWPPAAAVTYAKSEAEKNHLKRQAGDDTGFEMLSGGGSPSRKKQKALPPKLKEACSRDIRDGIVKDEKDFINSMSPKMREIYNL